MTSATDTHQPGRPRMKSRVPSIGSTHHIARHDSRSSLSAVSSDSHPASGTIAPSTAFRSEEHTSELQARKRTSYAVSCLQTQNQPHVLIPLLLTSDFTYL